MPTKTTYCKTCHAAIVHPPSTTCVLCANRANPNSALNNTTPDSDTTPVWCSNCHSVKIAPLDMICPNCRDSIFSGDPTPYNTTPDPDTLHGLADSGLSKTRFGNPLQNSAPHRSPEEINDLFHQELQNQITDLHASLNTTRTINLIALSLASLALGGFISLIISP